MSSLRPSTAARPAERQAARVRALASVTDAELERISGCVRFWRFVVRTL